MNFNIIDKNFIDLKYNLYDLLNVDSSSHPDKIKKHINKIIKTYHPDKKCNIELDIYSHIIICKQILLDIKNRYEYDMFLNEKSFVDLKENFMGLKENFMDPKENFINNDIKIIEKSFYEKNQELNNKHAYIESETYKTIDLLYNDINRTDITINKIEFEDTNAFNSMFEIEKSKKEKLTICTDIIVNPVNLLQNQNFFTSIQNIDKLYDDENHTSEYFLYDMIC